MTYNPSKPMRTIVAGSRDITNPQLIENAILASGFKIVEIVTGGARGVDSIAHNWAISKGYHTKVFPANWEAHGKAAGPIRNVEMAKYADALVAIWDGKSSGTKHMISEAEKRGLKVYVEIVNQVGVDIDE